MKNQTILFVILPGIFLVLADIGCKKNDTVSAPANQPPAAPSYLSPSDSTTGVSTSLMLSWTCTDPEVDPLIYDVYVGKTTPPSTIVSTNQSATSLLKKGLDTSSTYYWKVVAKDIHNNTTSGAIWKFTTGANVLAAGMVFVQGGNFQMGSPSSPGFPDESPQHWVTLNNFWMDRYEITQQRWREVVVWKQGASTSPLNPDPSYFHGDSLPVESVNWDDIQIWIGYLNQKEGTTKYRLPTEAEWEYGARGGIFWTDTLLYSGSNSIDSVAWYGLHSAGQTHRIGAKASSQLGIYDMTGNVSEWCKDWYGAYTSGAQNNPTGPAEGTLHVLRGGSCVSGAYLNNYYYDINNCRVANRGFYLSAGEWDILHGFRCVRDL